MKKLLSLLLVLVTLLGIIPTSAFAADSVEAALGEVDIYNGGYELGYCDPISLRTNPTEMTRSDLPMDICLTRGIYLIHHGILTEKRPFCV